MAASLSRFAFIALALIATAVPVSGQAGLSAEFDRDVYVPGQNVNMTLTAGVGLNFASGCVVQQVRSGSPTGPVVFAPFICPLIFITLNPCDTFTTGWNQLDSSGTQVADGDYWIGIGYFPNSGGALITDWFCARVDSNPPAAVLSANGSLTVGQTTTFGLSAPGDPFATYVVVASLRSNVGLLAGGVRYHVDQDFVFEASFPVPSPGIFSNFQGPLDATGQSPTIGITLPNTPILQCLPFKMQGAVISTSGGSVSVIPTNPLSLTIN